MLSHCFRTQYPPQPKHVDYCTVLRGFVIPAVTSRHPVLSAVTQLSPPRDHLSGLCPQNFSLVPESDDNPLSPICPEKISVYSVAANYLS